MATDMRSHQHMAPLDRRPLRDTFIENEPQLCVRQLPARANMLGSSPDSDRFSTSRSEWKTAWSTPATDQTSDASSLWSKRQSSSENDSLYNLTDDESVEVPLMISHSLKRAVAIKEKERSRYPSLIIPSPSVWPMPPSAQKSTPGSIGLSPASKLAVSPTNLAILRAYKAPSRASTPSLDGSLTSEELAASSCPSTPDLENGNETEGRWSPPVQLNSAAITLLQQIAPDFEAEEVSEQVIEITNEEMMEMQELVKDSPVRYQFVPGFRNPSRQPSPDEPLSALTVPSPGGFFASLNGSARQAWSLDSSGLPNTSVAEKFYGVPWRHPSPRRTPSPPRNPNPRPQPSRKFSEQSTVVSRGELQIAKRPPSPRPLTTRKASEQSTVTSLGQLEVAEITDVSFEYDNFYNEDLKRTAMASTDRTKLWLLAQNMYLATISAMSPSDVVKTPIEQQLRSCFSPDTPDTSYSFKMPTADESPSKKSVRFMESIPEDSEPRLDQPQDKIEPIFFQGFRYLTTRAKRLDAFRHQQTRAEASHVERISLTQQYQDQLSGNFEIKDVSRPAPPRPISTILPSAKEECENQILADAERERQVVEQLSPTAWDLQAQSQLFGNQLITSPVIATLRTSSGARILDYGGQASCDWAWRVALQHPQCTIITIPPPSASAESHLTGPPNHHVIHTSNPYTLPFPASTFDLISARSLPLILHTASSPGPKNDEYDALLAEFQRVLKPGGYLEFNLLDSELLHPSPLAHALSVEFAFNLRTYGYDPAASKSFLPRLRRAGFADVKRAWIVLPVGDVTPRWVDRGKNLASGGGTTSVEKGSMAFYSVPRSSPESTDAAKACSKGNGMAERGGKEFYDPPLMGSTDSIRSMTGLVGARTWERWMLALAWEMGSDSEVVLKRIGAALEESGKSGRSGWRCLLGWARKEK